MSARAAFAAAAAAVLALAAVPWAGGPLRRLAGDPGDGRDPRFDVALDAAGYRAVAAALPPGARYVLYVPRPQPLLIGNVKAAGQLYFADAFPVNVDEGWRISYADPMHAEGTRFGHLKLERVP